MPSVVSDIATSVLGAFRSQPTLGHPASDTNLSPRYPPYARPQRRLAVQSVSRFNGGVRRASLSPCAGPRHNQPSRRLRHECDASRDVLAGVLRTQNGPRCIQAAAGSCFAFAKRSVLRQTILRCRERMAHGRVSNFDFLGTPSDLTTQDRSGAATSKKQRSVYLARWSHSCSRRVADFVVRVANLRCDACRFARNSPSSHVIFLSNHDLGRTTSTGLIEWRSPQRFPPSSAGCSARPGVESTRRQTVYRLQLL